jgi:hypothetical protein
MAKAIEFEDLVLGQSDDFFGVETFVDIGGHLTELVEGTGKPFTHGGSGGDRP